MGHPRSLHGKRLRVQIVMGHVNKRFIKSSEPRTLELGAQMSLPAPYQFMSEYFHQV